MTRMPDRREQQTHLRVVDLHRRYGDHEVLRGVSFQVRRGDTCLVLGASGAGKSVLMRQLIRLEQPDSGEIWVNGQNIAALGETDLIPVRKKFGMVFQMSALFDSMSVYENVAFPLREHARLSATQIRERVMQRLRDLRVEHAAKKMPSEISGGMQKRVAVARALVLDTELLVYDEPTTGLDPITSRAVDDLIVETKERFGVTSLVISHDMASVFRIADCIQFLHLGRIAESGTPASIRRSRNPMTREFLEASGVNLSCA